MKRNMKRQLLVAALPVALFLLAVPLPAQRSQVRPSIAVQNEENAPFYFTVIHRDDAAFEWFTTSDGGALELLRRVGTLKRMVPPGGVAPQIDFLDEGFLVGLFVRPGSTAYPVVAVHFGPFNAVPAERRTVVVSREHVVRDRDGNEVAMRPWHARLGREPVVLDNHYLDWEPVPPLAQFPERFQPARFAADTVTGRSYEAIDRSRFWGSGGTRLDTFKAVAGERAVYAMASSHGTFERGTSILMFLYRDGDDRAARYTLEIPITGDSGWVLLWRLGVAEPEVVGNYVADTFVMEAQLRYDLLPAAVATFAAESGFFELATSFSGTERHEEFFHARVQLHAVPGL